MKLRNLSSRSRAGVITLASASLIISAFGAGSNDEVPTEEGPGKHCGSGCDEGDAAGKTCKDIGSLFWAMKVGHAHFPSSEDYNMMFKDAPRAGVTRGAAQGTGGSGSSGGSGGGSSSSGGSEGGVRRLGSDSLGDFGRNQGKPRGGSSELDDLIARYINRDPLAIDPVMMELVENSVETRDGFQVKGRGDFHVVRDYLAPPSPNHIAVDEQGNPTRIEPNGKILQVLSRTAFLDIEYINATDKHVRMWLRTDQRPPERYSDKRIDLPVGVDPIHEVIFRAEVDDENKPCSATISIERFGIAGEHINYERRYTEGEITTVTQHKAERINGVIKANEVIRRETVTHSERGDKIWDYTVERVIEEATTSGGGVMGGLVKVAHTKEVYGDYSEFAVFGWVPKPTGPNEPAEPYVFKGGRDNGRRLKSITHDFGGKNLTTTYDYEEDSKKGLGRLNWVKNPDGSWYKNQYLGGKNSATSAVISYESWKDTTFANFENGIRSETTVDRDGVTKSVSIGGQVVAKSMGLKKGDVQEPYNIVFSLDRFAGENALRSVRTFIPENAGNRDGGRPQSVRHEDGTLTTYSYNHSPVTGAAFAVTERTGAPSPDGKSVIRGTEKTTSYNSYFQEIEVAESDIASGLVTSTRTADLGAGMDGLMRPVKWVYNGNTEDYAIVQRTCCGIEFERDRTGATKQYSYDALKRPYKIISKASPTSTPVITKISYNGLTTTTTREAEIENGGVAATVTLLVEEVTKNLAGEVVERKTPDQNGDGIPEVTSYNTEHPGGVGTIHTTIYPDLSTKVVTTYRDGQLKSITGTAVSDEFYDHGVHNEQGGGLWTKVTQANGIEWVKTYWDAMGREIRKEYPGGAVELRTYHLVGAGGIGKLASITDPDQITTNYSYNDEGEEYSVTEPMPGNQQRVTTTDSNVIIEGGQTGFQRVKSINGVVIETSFSTTDGYSSRTERHGVISSWYQSLPSDGVWSSTSISGGGQKMVKNYIEGKLVKIEFFDNEDQSVSWKESVYDALDRVVSESDSRTGTVTFSAYTASGNLLSSIDGGARVTHRTYDVMGRKTTIDLPDTTDASGGTIANVIRASYYPTGKIEAVWGDQTNPTYRMYDEQNRIIELRTYRGLVHGTQPLSNTVGYDRTSWNYNSERGWLESKRDAMGGATPGNGLGVDYAYTAAGRLVERKWARVIGGGARLTTSYGYHAGRLTSKTYNDGVTQTIGYEYDTFGRQTLITQGGNSWEYKYDPVTRRLSSETITYDTDFDGVGDFTRILARSQDTLLRPTGYQLKDGTTLDAQAVYAYDNFSRLLTVGDGTDTFTYEYEPGGELLKKVIGPVHTVANTWDNTRDILLIKENKVGSSLLSAYEYQVNAIGQRESISHTSDVESAFSANWGYNGRGEVTSTNDSVNSYDRFYEFDAIGNRVQSRAGVHTDSGGVTTTYVTNALNQYTAINSVMLIHDADGSQLSGRSPLDPSRTLAATWDGENRMTFAEDNGSTVGDYRYDPFGRRIYKRSASAGVRWFIYDGWNLIAEYSSANSSTPVSNVRSHLWGIDLSGTIQGAGGVGGLLSTRASEHGLSGKYYPSYDGNGNVTSYLDAAGNVQAYFRYDSFGAILEASGVNSNFFIRFSSKYQDFETGLNYYGYRYYDPIAGRWLSRDPMAERGGVNMYQFCQSDGVNYVDAVGLEGGAFGHSKSMNETGFGAAKEAYKKTKEDKESYEYCGCICCKDGAYFATKSVRGLSPGRCTPDLSPCPEGSSKVGIYHSHPDRDKAKYPGPNDFSFDDYEVLDPGESNFLGNQDGEFKMKKTPDGKDQYGGDKNKPELSKNKDGKDDPYEPFNNGLRAEAGLGYLNNGTVDPRKGLR